MRFLYLVALFAVFVSCTEAERSRFKSLGKRAEAVCWNGGKVTFHGISTGRVSDAIHSDGYYAVWNVIEARNFSNIKKGDVKAFNLSGTCVIGYID